MGELVVRKLFRTMKADASGRPLPENSKRGLGVVALEDIAPGERDWKEADVEPDAAGLVQPRTGGMSVTPDDPMKMPLSRRPVRLKGRSKDPLFAVRSDGLLPHLAFRPDPRNPDSHGFVEPVEAVALPEYRADLAATAPKWWEVK